MEYVHTYTKGTYIYILIIHVVSYVLYSMSLDVRSPKTPKHLYYTRNQLQYIPDTCIVHVHE